MTSPYQPPQAELSSEGAFENNSGMGKGYPIPDGIEGWSWGAFLLTFIWSIGNRTWIGMASVVPYVGWIMHIVMGIKGRTWAWQNMRWESVEHFNEVQRKWNIWGIALIVGAALIGVLAAIAIPAYKSYLLKAGVH